VWEVGGAGRPGNSTYIYVKTTHICFKIVLLLSTYESMDKYSTSLNRVTKADDTVSLSRVTSKTTHNFCAYQHHYL